MAEYFTAVHRLAAETRARQRAAHDLGPQVAITLAALTDAVAPLAKADWPREALVALRDAQTMLRKVRP